MNSRILAVAGVQAAKLRRRKFIVLFGLAPFALSLMVAGPALLMFESAPDGLDLGPLFQFGMILGWGGFLSTAGCALALLLGATAVHRDITDATLFPVLAKPVSRLEAILGKYIGSAYVLGLYLAIEALIILAATSQAGPHANWWQVLGALGNDVLRLGAFLALGLAVGIILRPTVGLSVVAGCGIWLMLIDPLLQAQSATTRWFGYAALALFPHTSYWNNWLDTTSSMQTDPVNQLARLAYVILWGLLFLSLANWRFERRELSS